MGVFIHNVADVVVLFLLFSVTIFIHELFHFVTALKLGLVVETFSVGFGPALWQKKHKGITYKLGCIPFGGYVALPQLDPSGMATIQGSEEPKEKKRGFFGGKKQAKASVAAVRPPERVYPEISPWKKIPVAMAGVVGNLLFAILLAWLVYLSPDAETAQTEAVIGFVEEGVPAAAAGLQAGDRVLEVNGEAVTSWHDFTVLCVLDSGGSEGIDLTVQRPTGGEPESIVVPTTKGEMGETHIEGIGPAFACLIGIVDEGSSAEEAGLQPGDLVVSFDGVPVAGMSHFIALVAKRGGDTVPIRVNRKGEDLDLTVTPRFDDARGRALIGVQLSPAEIGVMPWMRHKKPWAQIKGDATEIARILKALVTPSESRQAAAALGGPVMILTYLWVSIKISIFNAIGFLRFLNVNLAILNLLPIPVLDGGHIVFSLWEGITRRKVAPRFVNALTNVFATLLICVFVLLTFRDARRVPRLFKGIKALLNDDTEEVQTNAVESVDATAE